MQELGADSLDEEERERATAASRRTGETNSVGIALKSLFESSPACTRGGDVFYQKLRVAANALLLSSASAYRDRAAAQAVAPTERAPLLSYSTTRPAVAASTSAQEAQRKNKRPECNTAAEAAELKIEGAARWEKSFAPSPDTQKQTVASCSSFSLRIPSAAAELSVKHHASNNTTHTTPYCHYNRQQHHPRSHTNHHTNHTSHNKSNKHHHSSCCDNNHSFSASSKHSHKKKSNGPSFLDCRVFESTKVLDSGKEERESSRWRGVAMDLGDLPSKKPREVQQPEKYAENRTAELRRRSAWGSSSAGQDLLLTQEKEEAEDSADLLLLLEAALPAEAKKGSGLSAGSATAEGRSGREGGTRAVMRRASVRRADDEANSLSSGGEDGDSRGFFPAKLLRPFDEVTLGRPSPPAKQPAVTAAAGTVRTQLRRRHREATAAAPGVDCGGAEGSDEDGEVLLLSAAGKAEEQGCQRRARVTTAGVDFAVEDNNTEEEPGRRKDGLFPHKVQAGGLGFKEEKEKRGLGAEAGEESLNKSFVQQQQQHRVEQQTLRQMRRSRRGGRVNSSENSRVSEGGGGGGTTEREEFVSSNRSSRLIRSFVGKSCIFLLIFLLSLVLLFYSIASPFSSLLLDLSLQQEHFSPPPLLLRLFLPVLLKSPAHKDAGLDSQRNTNSSSGSEGGEKTADEEAGYLTETDGSQPTEPHREVWKGNQLKVSAAMLRLQQQRAAGYTAAAAFPEADGTTNAAAIVPQIRKSMQQQPSQPQQPLSGASASAAADSSSPRQESNSRTQKNFENSGSGFSFSAALSAAHKFFFPSTPAGPYGHTKDSPQQLHGAARDQQPPATPLQAATTTAALAEQESKQLHAATVAATAGAQQPQHLGIVRLPAVSVYTQQLDDSSKQKQESPASEQHEHQKHPQQFSQEGWRGELAAFADFDGDSHVDMLFLTRRLLRNNETSPSSSLDRSNKTASRLNRQHSSGSKSRNRSEGAKSSSWTSGRNSRSSAKEDEDGGGLRSAQEEQELFEETQKRQTFISVYVWDVSKSSFGFFGETVAPSSVENIIALDWSGDGRTDVLAICAAAPRALAAARKQAEQLSQLRRQRGQQQELRNQQLQNLQRELQELQQQLLPHSSHHQQKQEELSQTFHQPQPNLPSENEPRLGVIAEVSAEAGEQRGVKAEEEGVFFSEKETAYYVVAYMQKAEGSLERVWDSISAVDQLLEQRENFLQEQQAHQEQQLQRLVFQKQQLERELLLKSTDKQTPHEPLQPGEAVVDLENGKTRTEKEGLGSQATSAPDAAMVSVQRQTASLGLLESPLQRGGTEEVSKKENQRVAHAAAAAAETDVGASEMRQEDQREDRAGTGARVGAADRHLLVFRDNQETKEDRQARAETSSGEEAKAAAVTEASKRSPFLFHSDRAADEAEKPFFLTPQGLRARVAGLLHLGGVKRTNNQERAVSSIVASEMNPSGEAVQKWVEQAPASPTEEELFFTTDERKLTQLYGRHASANEYFTSKVDDESLLMTLPLLRFSASQPFVVDVTMNGQPDLIAQLPPLLLVRSPLKQKPHQNQVLQPDSHHAAVVRRFVWLNAAELAASPLQLPLLRAAALSANKVSTTTTTTSLSAVPSEPLTKNNEEVGKARFSYSQREGLAEQAAHSAPSQTVAVPHAIDKVEVVLESTKEPVEFNASAYFLPTLWDDLSMYFEIPSDASSQQNYYPIASPHSSGFLDLSGDCRPDIVLQVEAPVDDAAVVETSKTKTSVDSYLEIWVNTYDGSSNRSKYRRKEGAAGLLPLPPSAGQIAFADFNADGSMDVAIPLCTKSETCHDCCVGDDRILFAPNRQPGLCPSIWTLSHDERMHSKHCKAANQLCTEADYSFPSLISPNEEVTQSPIDEDFRIHFYGDRDHPATLRVGDWNGDGFPDLALVVVRNGGYRTVRLYQNSPVKAGESFLREFRFVHELEPFSHEDDKFISFNQVAFFDLLENGSLDLLSVGEVQPPSSSPSPFSAVRVYSRATDADPRFLKATALSATSERHRQTAGGTSAKTNCAAAGLWGWPLWKHRLNSVLERASVSHLSTRMHPDIFKETETSPKDDSERKEEAKAGKSERLFDEMNENLENDPYKPQNVATENESKAEEHEGADDHSSALLTTLLGTSQVVRPFFKAASYGPSFKLTVTDLNGVKTPRAATQMSQSAYCPLQLPFVLFGLGRTNNYVEEFYAGLPLSARVHYNMWISLIPNSQVLISPTPLYQPQQWQLTLSVNPSKHFLYILLTTILCLVVVAIIIFILDQKEKAEDSEAQRGFRSHFIIN